MSPIDLRLLCTALGFVSVMGRESDLNAERELRIETAARMIEAFCLNKVPEGISREGKPSKRRKPAREGRT